ncbi:MAG: hypothetical protein OEY49_08970, partial [Candidatus Heimdallarchaeota archaeon]|nr:hypothetical protein [Candidatus Heimdallarchaeota archaeon]
MRLKQQVKYLSIIVIIVLILRQLNSMFQEYFPELPELQPDIPSLQWQFSDIFQLVHPPMIQQLRGVVAAVVVLITLVQRIHFSIPINHGLIYHFPLTFTSSKRIRIIGGGQLNGKLLSYLATMTDYTFSIVVEVIQQIANYNIILSRNRLFRPYPSSLIRRDLFSLIHALGFDFKEVPLNFSSEYKVHVDYTGYYPVKLSDFQAKLENYEVPNFIYQLNIRQKRIEKVNVDLASNKVGETIDNSRMEDEIQYLCDAKLYTVDKGQLTQLMLMFRTIPNDGDLTKFKIRELITTQIQSQDQNLQLHKLTEITIKPTKLPIGRLLVKGRQHQPFGIDRNDLARGGIITGSIGTGKTTLRLQLVKSMQYHRVKIIDFDLKGDAPRYRELSKDGLIFMANSNLQINPFENFSLPVDEYSNILYRTFVDTIPDHEGLTPPQKHILQQAIKKTVEMKGNARDFFHYLVVLGQQAMEVIENKQDASSQALLVKFSWMQTSLRSIFWQTTSSLRETELISNSLFFDLSKIVQTVPYSHIRFIINLILIRLMAVYRDLPPTTNSRQVIFLDESQILMPRRQINQELTPLEEILSTLRYKGISVIATGISAKMMSDVLLDCSFIAQFRSESRELLRTLGIYEEHDRLIPKLSNYTCILKSPSLGLESIHAYIEHFGFKRMDDEFYLNFISEQDRNRLIPEIAEPLEYELTILTLGIAKIDAVFSKLNGYNYPKSDEISKIREFMHEHLRLTEKYWGIKNVDKLVHVIINNYAKMVDHPDLSFALNICRQYYLDVLHSMILNASVLKTFTKLANTASDTIIQNWFGIERDVIGEILSGVIYREKAYPNVIRRVQELVLAHFGVT